MSAGGKGFGVLFPMAAAAATAAALRKASNDTLEELPFVLAAFKSGCNSGGTPPVVGESFVRNAGNGWPLKSISRLIDSLV